MQGRSSSPRDGDRPAPGSAKAEAVAADSPLMLGGLFKSRSVQRAEQATEAEALKAKLSPFGGSAADSPLRDQMADLRAQRNAGQVSEAEYAVKVADLLGTSESVIGE